MKGEVTIRFLTKRSPSSSVSQGGGTVLEEEGESKQSQPGDGHEGRFEDGVHSIRLRALASSICGEQKNGSNERSEAVRKEQPRFPV